MKNLISKLFKIGKYNIYSIIKYLIIISFLIIATIFLKKHLLIVNTTENKKTTEQIITLFGITLQNISTILTTLGLLLGGIWAMFQYRKSVRMRQQEKGAEIAKTFACSTVQKLSIICTILSDNEFIKNNVLNIKGFNFVKFNIYEIKSLISDVDILIQYDKLLRSEELQEKYTQALNERFSEKEKEFFPSKFIRLIESTLNELEYMCMDISSNAAGTQFIYSSLHQIFLRTIQLLSIKISILNQNSVDIYYANIIHVYNLWNNQKSIDIKKLDSTKLNIKKLRSKKKKEIDKLTIKIDKKVNKLLSKKPKTI